MVPMKKADAGEVEVRDELTANLEAGFAYASSYYETGRSTLVDRFSFDELMAWDASNEAALVSDDGSADPADIVMHDRAA